MKRIGFPFPAVSQIRFIAALSLSAFFSLASHVGAAPGDPLEAGRVEPRLESDRLEPDQQRELQHLIEDVTDPRAAIDRRRRAAAILLDRNWPAAIAALRQLVSVADDSATVRSIAQAVGDVEAPSPLLIAPLLRRLSSEEAAVRADVAAALGCFDDAGLVNRLVEIANDKKRTAEQRVGAIAALSGHRNQLVVKSLMEIVWTPQEPAIRQATFDSLARLTGIDRYGDDVEAWSRWWSRAQKLSASRWLSAVMQNLAARNTQLRGDFGTLSARLIATNNQLYDAAPEPARAAILQQMLGDPMSELRLLAMKLIERRVLNAQPVADELKLAMRSRLTDVSPPVRAEAAKLLENLADKPAAARVVELVLGETEPAVQVAQLGLLARIPRPEAIEPALVLMDKPEVAGAAAAVLVAANDAKLLTEAQSARALLAVRAHLKSGSKLDPMMLRLLSRVGSDGDQELITQALAEPDAAVRLAAVEAFASDRRPLEPLYPLLADESLRAPVIQVIARRGRDSACLLKLLASPPKAAEQQPEWRSAALAVAGRLDLESLVQVDQQLAATPERRELHEEVLKTAAGLTTPPPTSVPPVIPPVVDEAVEAIKETVKTEATFRLADFYLRGNEPGKAKTAQARLTARTNLNEDQRRRLALSRLQRMLSQQALDEAGALTQTLLTEAKPAAVPAAGPPVTPVVAPPAVPQVGLPIQPIAALWLDAIDTSIKTQQFAPAAAMVKLSQELLGAKLTDDDRKRLDAASKKLPAVVVVPPAAPAVATPVAPVVPLPK
jgi:HEAT repeat protein